MADPILIFTSIKMGFDTISSGLALLKEGRMTADVKSVREQSIQMQSQLMDLKEQVLGLREKMVELREENHLTAAELTNSQTEKKIESRHIDY